MAHPVSVRSARCVRRLAVDHAPSLAARAWVRRWLRARFRGGPIDLGAPDGERRFPLWSSLRRVAGSGGSAARMNRSAQVRRRRVDVAARCEMNQRQREIFDDVVGKAKTKLQAPELAEALGIIGREPFEREAVEFLVGKGELADDLEHLHFSLTPEQRAKLRNVASA